MSIQNNLDALKATLVGIPNKSQPITVAQAITLSNLLLELYGAIQSVEVPTLQEVLDEGNTADIGLTVASITLGETSELSSIGLLGEAVLTPNGVLTLVVSGVEVKVSAEIGA